MLNREKPTYQRIRETIAKAILDETYSTGEMLPSVRALAAQEGANPLTVAKAYHVFQEQGLIIVRRGIGMFVAPGARERLQTHMRHEFLNKDWPHIAAHIQRLNIEPNTLLETLESAAARTERTI